MENKTVEITTLLEKMKEPLARDWEAQRERGERTYAISLDKLQGEMHKAYPAEVPKTFFKTIYINHRINEDKNDPATRSTSIDRLHTVIRFFYEDKNTPYGWPETTKFLSEFAGGKYFYLVEPYMVNQGNSARIISDNEAAQAGATKGAPYYIQLLQLMQKAKGEWEEQQREMKKLKEQDAKKAKAIEEAKEIEKKTLETIARLEGVISVKGGDKEFFLKALNEIKQKLG